MPKTPKPKPRVYTIALIEKEDGGCHVHSSISRETLQIWKGNDDYTPTQQLFLTLISILENSAELSSVPATEEPA